MIPPYAVNTDKMVPSRDRGNGTGENQQRIDIAPPLVNFFFNPIPHDESSHDTSTHIMQVARRWL